MDNDIIDLLRTVANSFQMRMKERIAHSDAGLSAFEARLLHLIGRHDGISQLTLGAFTERDKAQIARTIKALEASGLVTRSVKTTDKRSKSLRLTATGQEKHRQLTQLREQIAIQALNGLSSEEKQLLHASLAKMTHALLPQDTARPSSFC